MRVVSKRFVHGNSGNIKIYLSIIFQQYCAILLHFAQLLKNHFFLFPARGRWSAWNQGQCSVTCGQGTSQYFRQCTTPNGQQVNDCSGASREQRQCNLAPCVSSNFQYYFSTLQFHITCCNLVLASSRCHRTTESSKDFE